jgi:hypothetical protein
VWASTVLGLTRWKPPAILCVGAAIRAAFLLSTRFPGGGRKEVDTPKAGEYHR